MDEDDVLDTAFTYISATVKLTVINAKNVVYQSS